MKEQWNRSTIRAGRPQDFDAAREMYSSGLSRTSIAAHFRVSYKTIHNWTRDIYLTMEPECPPHLKRCSKCLVTKQTQEFSCLPSGRPISACRPCIRAYHRARTRNPEYHEDYRTAERKHRLKSNFGITLDEYQTMFDSQDGLCAVCLLPQTERRLAVDHDHETGVVRGLLCVTCNRGLGAFEDDVDLFKKAAEYLRPPTGQLLPGTTRSERSRLAREMAED